jgi:hypothetical protein
LPAVVVVVLKQPAVAAQVVCVAQLQQQAAVAL